MAAPRPRKPTFLQAFIIQILKLWDSTPFRWYRLPVWTLLPVIYPALRRYVLAINLIEIEQLDDTPLANRVRKTKIPLAANQMPMTRLDDAWGNDVEHPGAGSTGATIGRNMAEVPRALRGAAADPHPQLVAQKAAREPPHAREPYWLPARRHAAQRPRCNLDPDHDP
jgi:hypothetical protein